MRIAISSGHGKKIRGACYAPCHHGKSWGLDEVDEARRVVEHVADYLGELGVETETFHDDHSTSQSENLSAIVDWHNSQSHVSVHVSVHFNAYEPTSKAMGVEVLYLTQQELAKDVSARIADAGDFLDRGAKKRTDLAFLNGTEGPAILIETCFVDSEADANLYRQNFDLICKAIAEAVAGEQVADAPKPEQPPTTSGAFKVKGPCSWFGGPADEGVDSDEGLAFFYKYEDAPHLFLPQQPSGTTGLARRLNPGLFYVAARWDYSKTSKQALARPSVQALVRTRKHAFYAWPGDWGPHADTGRVADLSPALMQALELHTDDEVEVVYPAPEYEPETEV